MKLNYDIESDDILAKATELEAMVSNLDDPRYWNDQGGVTDELHQTLYVLLHFGELAGLNPRRIPHKEGMKIRDVIPKLAKILIKDYRSQIEFRLSTQDKSS